MSRICILFFNFFFIFGFSQVKVSDTKDSIKSKNKTSFFLKKHFKTEKKHQKLLLGVDLLHLSLIPFSDTKNISIYTNYALNKTTVLAADIGFESLKYFKNQYKASANGVFIKLGINYMLISDFKNPLNGFYTGLKMGLSKYNQNYETIPIKGFRGNDGSLSLPKSTEMAAWMEIPIGARIQVFESNIYLDFQLQPKFLIFQTKQENLKAMIIPGFGQSASNATMGYMWAVAYKF